MKKLLSLLLTLTLIGTACLLTAGCSLSVGTTPPISAPAESATAASYVVVDINPTVEMTLSEEELVVTATASNDDAKILLNQADVEGKTLEEATELLADASIELGFISEGENSEISITVVADTAELEEKVFGKIRDKFCAHVQEKCHFTLGVVKDVLLSVESELNDLKAANPENQAIRELNIAKYRLIVSAMEKDSTLTLETALTMSTRDLVRIIRDGAAKHIGAEFEKLEIEMEYEMQQLQDKVYTDMLGVLVLDKTIQLAALRELEYHIELLEECEMKGYETVVLTEENVKQVAALLALTEEETAAFLEKCVGLDGTYSVHNMKYAINRIYRNLAETEREAFKEGYDLVEDYIETLEKNIVVPNTLVVILKGYVDSYNRVFADTPVTMPESFATLAELDAFLEIFEEAVEERIEAIEDYLEEQVEKAGKKAEFESKMDALENDLDAKEEELEREHDRLKGELEEEFRQHLDSWMDRHHGNGQGGNSGNP